MRIAVSVNFQFSLFSGGVQGCALSVADTLKSMGHEVTLLNRGSSNDWWEDVNQLKELWPNRVQWDNLPANAQYDLLVELSWFCTPEERKKVAKRTVWFSRKPALLSDMEVSTYLCSNQKRDLQGISEVWTWDWVSSDDITYIECLTNVPVKRLPYVWTPTIVEIHMRSVGYPYWSDIQGRPAESKWRIHVAETNNTNSSSTVLPLVTLRELKRRDTFPLESWRVHNADNLMKSEFFKDNVLAHAKIEGLSGEFLGRQRCIDWCLEPTSCLLSHVRFLPYRPMHLDCVWAGFPMVHNSLLLKELGCGWDRLYYPDNSITDACEAFTRLQEDYTNKSGIFAKNARDTVRGKLLQMVGPDSLKDKWSSILALNTFQPVQPVQTVQPVQPVQPVLQPVQQVVKPAEKPVQTKKFRLAFTDMWDNFNPSYNFFTLLLEEASSHLKEPYAIEVVKENPDLLIFGPFGESWKSFNCAKVHFTGENSGPVEDPSVKLNLGYKHINFSDDSYMRLPLWMLEIDWFNADVERIQNPKPIPIDRVTKVYTEEITRKTKFCSFIVTNPKNPIRNQAFLALNSYKKVDSAGRLFNNVGNQIFAGLGGGGGELRKLEFLKDYRFSITYENESANGYTTEKLLHAKAAGAVPIYWGDPVVERDFDPAGFVDARGCRDTDDLVKLVKQIDENPEEWRKRFNVPALDTYKRDLVRRNLSELARRMILLGLSKDVSKELPRFLGATESAKVVEQQQPQQQQHKPLIVTAANFKFLPSLHHWLNSLSTDSKKLTARVYLWSDVPSDTITTLSNTYTFAEFLRFPENFKPFPDFWDPSHYAWKCWIYNAVNTDPTVKGRLVLYLDSGAMLIRWPQAMFDVALQYGACFLEDNTQYNRQWCHSASVKHLQITNEELDKYQIVAGISAFQAGSPLANKIFTDAFQYAQNREIIAGAKWEGIRNGKPYGHRHDQSILSIVTARNNAVRLPLYDYYSHESLRIASITGMCFYVHRGNFVENKAFLPKIDDAFLINLENRKDRLDKLLSTHPELKGRLSKVNACNGRQLKLTPSIARLFKPHDFMWKKSIMGCALSHLSVWQRLLDDSVNSYLIMEDDVKFQRGWQEQWYAAVAAGIPEDFDVIYLGGILPPNKLGFEAVKEKYNQYLSRVLPNQIFGQQQPTRYFHFCNYAYILSKKGAKKIMDSIVQHNGYWTSADHMVCNKVYGPNEPNGMISYFLDPLVAGCYQDDDPKYANSQFNNFNRVDGFDSDLWNNDDRFTNEEIIDCFSQNPALDIKKALQDAFLPQVLPQTLAQQALEPLSKEIHDRLYFAKGHGLNHENLWESGWLAYLIGKKSFQLKEHGSTVLENNPIFLYQKPHFAAYEALANMYFKANKPYSIIHLSDENCNDPIDIYKNAKKVLRFYNRPGLSNNVNVIPLGIHWGPTRNHHPSHPLINSPSLPFRETVWSFFGTKWSRRDQKLEALKQLGPHKLNLYDSWESKKLGEKEYLSCLLDSVFVPCPSGNNSETYRFYEALDCGAIPILSKDDMDSVFLDFISKSLPLIVLNNWNEAASMVQQLMSNKEFMEKYRIQLMTAWYEWKLQLQTDVKATMGQ